ncbi:MAG: hypothetical protein HXY30_13320 [Pseudorhodoplanes sp.]|nr:hypothetical protein [Pseudorhodoplanes sp.]
MADTAYQKQYRQEFIAGFEQNMSHLAHTVTTEAVIKGNEAVFLVADTGGAEPVTRGVNGLIPARADNLTQNTATLAEWHDKPRRTRFNIFASQGDGRRILQEGTRKVINRKRDKEIMAELATGTIDTGATQTMSLSLVTKVRAALGNNDVPVEEEDNMFFLASHAAEAYLLQIPEFTKADYVDVKPLNGPARRYRRWCGFNWIFHPHVPGKGTNAEKCFAYHRSAIGHAVNTGEMNVSAGYNDEDDYYWARASLFMGSKKLQNAGIVVVNHDGAAVALS